MSLKISEFIPFSCHKLTANALFNPSFFWEHVELRTLANIDGCDALLTKKLCFFMYLLFQTNSYDLTPELENSLSVIG